MQTAEQRALQRLEPPRNQLELNDAAVQRYVPLEEEAFDGGDYAEAEGRGPPPKRRDGARKKPKDFGSHTAAIQSHRKRLRG